MPKATPAQMKRDHAISRGLHKKGSENERKGIDKRKGVRYTVSTIINKIKRRDKKMADKNTTNNKPAKKQAKSWVSWQTVLGVLILAPFAFNGVLAFTKEGYSAYALAGVVVAFGAYLILEKRSK